MKKYIRLISLFTSMLILFSVIPFTAAAAFSDWDTSGWKVTKDDGTDALQGIKGQMLNLLYSSRKINENSISFDIRMEDSTGTVDGSIGVSYYCSNGSYYFCEYNTVNKIVRIRRLGNGADDHVGNDTAYELKVGTWYHFECTFADSYITWSINNDRLFTLTNTNKDTFDNASYCIQGYWATPTLKNIVISDKEIDDSSIMKYDFEFQTEQSIKAFSAENGTVAYSSGKLVYNLTGKGYITSPVIEVPKGNAYSAKLDVKNTVFARLKNSTNASQIKVSFITSEDGEYDEAKSKVFAIGKNAGFESLFFNFSDNPKASGYLRGLRFELVGASSGSLEIDAITFEREAILCEYVGAVSSCLTDGKTVTVKGTVDEKYAGKTVSLYETEVDNYRCLLKNNEIIASVQSNGTSFEIQIPFENNNITRLSSVFLAGVDGNLIEGSFNIENYRDFTENPYEFSLPDYSVKVTDSKFGALGDAFTDDTGAIQAAIDHVSSHGGGCVIIPGDNSFYGRRYVATNIKMKDNVELRIESGAIIWQSPRAEDYKYEVAYGHDISIPGVNWTHAGSCHNYPLIQGYEVKNIKITGGGTIRCNDAGGENLDGVDGVTIWTGCSERIHLIPIGMYLCENIEISDINLRRSNCYHLNLRACNNVALRNVSIDEPTCASGDGFSLTIGTKNVLIDRCYAYSNDDIVVLCSSYNDPRGLVWWHARPGEDNCIANVNVVHCNLFGGHGITFITWGTDAPDVSLQEIKDVTVSDCVLHGASSVGTWPDNPYYGKKPFDNSETSDYSPVKNITILNNRYRASSNLQCILATNFITDCGIKSAPDFVNGDFERKNGKAGWVSGLSNWTESGDCSFVEREGGHSGRLSGKAKLYQGLYMETGNHVFTVDTSLTCGEGRVTVTNAVTGTIIAEEKITSGKTTLSFMNSISGVYLIGTETTTDDAELFIDNASVTTTPREYPQYFKENFNNQDVINIKTDGWNFVSENKNGFISSPEQAGIAALEMTHKYSEFDLTFDVRIDAVLSDVDGNIGISVHRQDGNNQVYFEYNTVSKFLLTRRFSSGNTGKIDGKDPYTLETGVWYRFGLRSQAGKLSMYIDGEKVMEGEDGGEGLLRIACYNTACSLDNIVLARAGELDMNEIISAETTDVISTERESTTEVSETNPDTVETNQTESQTEAGTKDNTPQSTDGQITPKTPGKIGIIISVIATVILAAAAAVTVLILRKKKQA